MWELDVLQWFDSVHGPVLDPLMVGITYSATSGLVWFVLGFLMTCSQRWRRCGVSVIVSVIIAYIVMAIIAVPMYAYKGEQYQENVDYNLDDVKAVEGKDDKNEER